MSKTEQPKRKVVGGSRRKKTNYMVFPFSLSFHSSSFFSRLLTSSLPPLLSLLFLPSLARLLTSSLPPLLSLLFLSSLALQVFCASVGLPKLKLEDPGMTFGERNKALGALWRALSDEEKAQY